MAQMYPETEETPEAAEGTASHEVGAKLVKAASIAAGFIDLPVGQAASNGVLITDEMYEAAEVYANDVHEVMDKLRNYTPSIEQRVEAPNIHELSWGTDDCHIWDAKTGHLYIWDYKYGHGVVEVFENWQLINYTAGIINKLELDGILTRYMKVHMRVVQPRAFHRDGMIREWIVTASDLRGYFNQLEGKAHEALGANPVTRSGKHCKDCTGRHACEAALRGGVQLYEVAAQPMPMELPHNALGVQLGIVDRAIKQLEYVKSGMSEQVRTLVASGVNIPGWGMEPTRGKQTWSKPISEVLAMGKLAKHDLRKKDAVITPKQAIALGVDASVIKAYSSTSTGLKLAPDNENKVKRLYK